MDKLVATIDEPIPANPALRPLSPPQPPPPNKVLNPIAPQVLGMGMPRAFLGNRFVYAVISQRANGLSIGVNMNPDKFCNFDCAYCEVNRDAPPNDRTVDLAVLAAELESLLLLVCRAKL